MNEKMIGFVVAVVLVGCSSQPGGSRGEGLQKADIPEARCRIFVEWNSHKITAWINDEPVLVWDDVSAGSNKLFFLMLHKGINYLHFTANRLPPEKTKEFAGDLPSDGSTTVKLRFGGMFGTANGKPFSYNAKDILAWTATKDIEASPRWSVYSGASFRPSLDRYDPVSRVDGRIRGQIKEFLIHLKEALKSKDLSKVGVKASDYDDVAKEIGAKSGGLSGIYTSKPYYVDVAPLEKLKIIHGKRTIMVYCPDGKPVFFAGRDPNTPTKIGYSESQYAQYDEMYFVLRNGKLQPLWIRRY